MTAPSAAPRPGASPAAAVTVLFFIAYPQRLAGANRSLLELVTNLPEHVRPLVVCAAEGQAAEAYRARGIPCEILPAPGVLGRYGRRIRRFTAAERLRALLVDMPAYTLRLRRIMARGGVDLVHANDPRGTFLALPAARLAGLPMVAHLRGEFSHGGSARRLFETAAARIITVSDGARSTLSPRGRARARTVYNGIRATPAPATPLPWLASLRGDGVVVVSCFASVVPFKGHHHLIRAAAELESRGVGHRVAFVCVGDLVDGYGFYHEWLVREMDRLNVRNVTFTGWQDDPYAFYARSDVTVLPSVSRERLQVGDRVVEVHGNEGFPRTHLESMSLGVPVVGTRIAGVPEQVEDGVTGTLVAPGDPVALADALEPLLADAALRARMGAAGRERVRQRFSTGAYVEGVLGVYAEVLRRPGLANGPPAPSAGDPRFPGQENS